MKIQEPNPELKPDNINLMPDNFNLVLPYFLLARKKDLKNTLLWEILLEKALFQFTWSLNAVLWLTAIFPMVSATIKDKKRSGKQMTL